jgi:hypothetical protein
VTERSGRGGGSAGTGRAAAAERITVALTPQAAADLQKLLDRTGQGKTDIVNRAISLYEFINAQMSAGHELIVRNQVTGETQLIRFL